MVTSPQAPPPRPISLARARRHLAEMIGICEDDTSTPAQKSAAADLVGKFAGWIAQQEPSRPTR